MLEKEMRNLVVMNEELRRAAAKEQAYFLDHASFTRAGEIVETSYLPKVYDAETLAHFQEILRVSYGIVEKVIKQYIKDPEYRKIFGFPKEIEELICIPNLYDSYFPQGRFDIFYHEEDRSFGFCEINADGTGAMNRQNELFTSMDYNAVYQELLENYDMTYFDPLECCVCEILKLYETYEKKVENPNIAIVDFVYDGSSYAEWSEFARRFRREGHRAVICDIRNLQYRNGHLYTPSGMQVDLILRRAVTTDIIKYFDEVQDFIQAVKDQNVCLMGSFCTQVVHNKMFSVALHLPETAKIMTDEENAFIKEHFPYTAVVSEDNYQDFLKDKDRWILKPEDSYCCGGIYTGPDVPEELWEETLKKCAAQQYIIQALYPYEKTTNIDVRPYPHEFKLQDGSDVKPFEEGHAEEETAEEKKQELFDAARPHSMQADDLYEGFRDHINMTGIYVFNGQFGGIFHRQAVGSAIISEVNERSMPTLFIV